jgi:hypothetical protein
MGPYIDTTPPVLVSAVVRDAAPNKLVLTFNEAAMADSAEGWSVTGATIKGNPSGLRTWTWTFTLSAAVSPEQTLRISYDASVGFTGDSAGNAMEDIVSHRVINYVGQPEDDSSNPFEGSWTGDDGALTITDSTWELAGDVKGDYTRNGNMATLTITYYWSGFGWMQTTGVSFYTATVSGTTLTVAYDGETLAFTKVSGGASANPFLGTWTGDDGVITIVNSAWEMAEVVRGTYTRIGNVATFATTHVWSYSYRRWDPITGEPPYTATVLGNTLTVIYAGKTLVYTKKSGDTGAYAYAGSTINLFFLQKY